MTFDRLIYIDRLKDAGVSESVACAHAEALRDALFETVATKADLNEVRNELKEDIRAVRVEMKNAFETLDHKVEITARDLTIRGAAGLVVIASVIIGLKLFG